MFFKYLIGAIQLVPQTYSDIAEDRSVLKSALILAIFSSVATGVGNASGYPEKIPIAAGFAFVAWMAWALLIYILGTKLFRETDTPTDMIALFSIAGFASLPGLTRILAYLPPFTGIVSAGAMLWMFAMMVVGIKQAFHYRSMPRAIAVTLLSWPFYQWLLSQA